jgi:hypothetical protein
MLRSAQVVLVVLVVLVVQLILLVLVRTSGIIPTSRA